MLQWGGLSGWCQNQTTVSREVEELLGRFDARSHAKTLATLKDKGIVNPTDLIPYFDKYRFDPSAWDRTAAVASELLKNSEKDERQRMLDYLNRFASEPPHPYGKSFVASYFLKHCDDTFALQFMETRASKADLGEINSFIIWISAKPQDWLKSTDQAEAVVGQVVKNLPLALERTAIEWKPLWFALGRDLQKYPFTEKEFAAPIIEAASKALERVGAMMHEDVDFASELLFSRHHHMPEEVFKRVAQLVTGGTPHRAKVIWWRVIKHAYADEKTRQKLRDMIVQEWPRLEPFVDAVQKRAFVTDREGEPALREEVVFSYREERNAVIDAMNRERRKARNSTD
jgi:hypothetical protein